MPKYATIKQTAKLYSDLYTESALRGLIAKSKDNGFDKCLRRIETKIIINLDEFEKWIEEHKANDKSR